MKKIVFFAATLPLLSGCIVKNFTTDPTTPPAENPAENPPTAQGSVATSSVTLDGAKVGMSTAAANGDDLVFNPQTNALTVDGDLPSSYKMASLGKLTDGTFPIGVVYGTYTDGDINKSFASPINQLSSVNATVENHSTSSWNWTGVNYGYTTADGSSAPTDHSASDGTISANLGANPQWSATFGDVVLTGTVNGTDVSGAAVYGDMTGQFSGIDGSGIIIGSTKINNGVTTGGFAGDNGGDNSFAGGWFGYKP